MFGWVKDHPFGVDAFFDTSLVLAFAVPKDEVAALLPECLEADVFKNRWAFVAAAMVQTKDLRPRGFPKIFGRDFSLIGYRIFVRYTDKNGQRMRGLYIIGSATDRRSMETFGNIFTHYNYKTIDITRASEDGITTIESQTGGLKVVFEEPNADDVPLPRNSPFANWQEARKFEGPMPFTFTYDQATRKVVIIEGVRQNWKPLPVSVLSYNVGFIDQLGFSEVQLANAFMVRDIPYHWKKGRVEYWTPR